MTSSGSARERMLEGLPVQERRMDLAGVSTAVLEGGSGRPMVLLHGPGEFAGTWLPVLPQLVRSYRVVVPDLPGHGASGLPTDTLDADRVLDWLSALVDQTCSSPPILVGRVVGGAIGARLAAERPGRLSQLVLVDTAGLSPFQPDPRFELALQRFLARPDAATYERAMDMCAFDVDRARERLGARWEHYAAYAVECVRRPTTQTALGALFPAFMTDPIPPAQLDRIDVPTALVWGREDLATALSVAKAAAARHGWPLHVVDAAGDDPPLDQPEAFLDALFAALGAPTGTAVTS